MINLTSGLDTDLHVLSGADGMTVVANKDNVSSRWVHLHQRTGEAWEAAAVVRMPERPEPAPLDAARRGSDHLQET